MDTIFAPITAKNGGAISVIRISGPNCRNCLKILGVKQIPANRSCFFQKIRDPRNFELIDESLITFFPSPNSFTGEDVAEISIHNSPYILRKISQILLEDAKIEFAQPGEFSKRAVLNGKIDLIQAEAIPDLINSETQASHRQALNQLQGKLSKIYEDWREKIIEISALIAAAIDFPDEDLPTEIWQKAQNEVNFLTKQIEAHLDDKRIGNKIRDGFLATIIGAPNVGKSSLLNFFANREAAIVSSQPGTTRDIIEIHLQLAGLELIIADTAGIRTSDNEIEQEGIKRALQRAENADLKILMLDATKLANEGLNPDFQDSPMLQFQLDEKAVMVINKIDQIPNFEESSFFSKNSKLGEMVKKLKTPPVFISVINGQNLKSLVEILEKKLQELLPNQNFNFITQERYRGALKNCLTALNDFSYPKEIELAAQDLRIAAFELGKITGKIDVENILDAVFSKFCIGK